MKIIEINHEHVHKCYNFSKDIIQSQNQYNRFNKNLETQIERTFVGKLGEYAFLLLLNDSKIDYPEGDMFEIFPGQTNVDSFDFLTKNDKKVDIKVASKPFHSRIMVPIDQFKLIKDYYVGIKLNFKLNTNESININSVDKAIIYGYCLRKDLENSSTKNFGEGLCKHTFLKKLNNIEPLIKLF